MATQRKRAEPESESGGSPPGEPLHIKYRPTVLDDVVGQDAVVSSLKSALKAKQRQHTYFFFGPAGVGKTTLARIMARELGCSDVVEIDAASNTGIDDMRRVLETARYAGFGEHPGRAYIVDECHRLSAAACDSMLKTTEEPPDHVYFFFCSSNPGKVPQALLTRGPNYALQAVRRDDMLDLLEYVAKSERFQAREKVLDAVVRAAEGSPRRALVMLAQVADMEDLDEVNEALQRVDEKPEVIELCRLLVKGDLGWKDVQRLVAPLEDLGAEGIRIQVSLYLAKVLSSCGERQAPQFLNALLAFSKPCNPTDKLAPIYLALGEVIFGGE